MNDLPDPPDDDDEDDSEWEMEVEELVESLIDDFALMEDDDLIQIVPILDTIVMPRDDLPLVTGSALVWASEQVLGEIKEAWEVDAQVEAEFAQGKLDAAATGCPPEMIETMGFALATYPKLLKQIADSECHIAVAGARPPSEDINGRAEGNKVDRMFTTMRQGLVRVAVATGQSLNRTTEMISTDVIDARRKGRADAEKIIQMAIARTWGEI